MLTHQVQCLERGDACFPREIKHARTIAAYLKNLLWQRMTPASPPVDLHYVEVDLGFMCKLQMVNPCSVYIRYTPTQRVEEEMRSWSHPLGVVGTVGS